MTTEYYRPTYYQLDGSSNIHSRIKPLTPLTRSSIIQRIIKHTTNALYIINNFSLV
jgi:hypothetical protein